MPTFYLDYGNGADANAGDSFAAGHAWKTFTSGATAARIAPGDTIRVAKSPNPASIGNATWTSLSKTVTLATAQTTNIDLCETAWTAMTGIVYSINATPTNGGADYTVGDLLTITTGGTGCVVVVKTVASGVVTALEAMTHASTVGGSGYTTGTGKVTTGGTGTGCTVNITAVGNTTVTRTAVATAGKEGSYCMKIDTPPSAPPNTLLAYYNLATIDASTKQKLSFWLYEVNAGIPVNTVKIALCTDNAGATIADSFPIPAIIAYGSDRWHPLTITKDGGGNLSSAIESIAIYSGSAVLGAKNIYLDDFVACTTSGLNLQSLISKNSLATGGTETWHGIQSINDTTVMLDMATNYKPATTNQRGYYTSGTTPETVETYIRETIKTIVPSNVNTVIHTINDSGTAGNLITFSGGWNTSTDEQDGETYWDGSCNMGKCIDNTAKNYIAVERIKFVRYGIGYNETTASTGCDISIGGSNNSTLLTRVDSYRNAYTIDLASNNSSCLSGSTGSYENTFTLGYINGNGGNNNATGFNHTIVSVASVSNTVGAGLVLGNKCTCGVIADASYNTTFGLNFSASTGSIVYGLTANGNTTYGVGVYGGDNTIQSLVTADNTSGGVYIEGTNTKLRLLDPTIGEATKVVHSSTATDKRYQITVGMDRYGGDVTDNRSYGNGFYICSQTAVRNTASGVAWRADITDVVHSTYAPITLTTFRVACDSSGEVTASLYVKLSHATDIGAMLSCRKGQIGGLTVTQTDTKTEDTDWEQLSVAFTPDEIGVVEIVLLGYWRANAADESIYWDDFSISQA